MRAQLPHFMKGRRPSPSLVVAGLALVVATGGTSYAAVMITGADVKNGSLTGKDLKSHSVTGKDIRNQSLDSRDVKNGSLQSKDFREGDLPQGEQGPAGVGRWALINAAGAIEAQSGGFTVTAGYPTLAPTATDPTGLRANGNVYINANEPLGNNGIVATIALQNTVDQDGDGIMNGRDLGPDANPEFSGEIAVAMCTPGVVNCAPPGTNTNNHLVVSPRNSDGSFTTDGARKRFYVVVTGDSSDRS